MTRTYTPEAPDWLETCDWCGFVGDEANFHPSSGWCDSCTDEVLWMLRVED